MTMIDPVSPSTVDNGPLGPSSRVAGLDRDIGNGEQALILSMTSMSHVNEEDSELCPPRQILPSDLAWVMPDRWSIDTFSPSIVSPDKYYLISASKDHFPMLRDGPTGDWIGTYLQDPIVRAVSLNHHGGSDSDTNIVSGGHDDKWKILDVIGSCPLVRNGGDAKVRVWDERTLRWCGYLQGETVQQQRASVSSRRPRGGGKGDGEKALPKHPHFYGTLFGWELSFVGSWRHCPLLASRTGQ
ncbi:hypothetical protein BDF20DRAFT_999477 [Mycotypha africana]|uniref:uncharacterized protein n=1 Tax=Mycotypha africana TaxID=64632 RepID=UPI002300E992|nr:uncharacterized protein BDF20DRAFT_999477 [Mycotypha africana]KAI8984492.1 hypothetical protein BDF20DRAFT_999477 [Mycotypha africana]